MPFQQALQQLTDMLKEMKTVGRLDGIRGTSAGSFGILAGAVAGNQLDAWMRDQPLFHHVS
jgi:hypothetical protein